MSTIRGEKRLAKPAAAARSLAARGMVVLQMPNQPLTNRFGFAGGVHIGVSAHNRPGSRFHREMWYLRKGGMPIEDVLRAATMGNAEELELQEEIGSLGPGKIADFVVLDANPLDDILNTLSLEYTVQGGVVYDSDTALPVDLHSVREADLAVAH